MTDELIAEILKLATNTAHAVAGIPDHLVEQPLARLLHDLQDELSDAIGSDGASLVVAEFMKTVATCKVAIERGAGIYEGIQIQ